MKEKDKPEIFGDVADDKPTENPKSAEPAKESKKEVMPVAEFVFKSNVKHNGKYFKKGEVPGGFSEDILKAWKANGVLISKVEFDKRESIKKKSFRN